ncbi:hypothetical protein BJ508DRAFT_363557 [Ascobolus immersus RN42]|uniref:Uncharacterized protein n=1 Tax=Ascobolus immersus RN42 TaxID=1160509 RepID=A0A3N4HYJ7_ASCIM|nr:hypothetical protein BJ508DRAFT_363557 [Ascobolus immersus RN42]
MSTTTTNSTLTDPLLTPFLSPTFTPTTYLNRILPTLPTPLPTSSQPQLPQPHTNTQRHLTSLEIHLQKLLSQLSTTSTTLLRLSPRLQYETKVLESQVSSVRKALAASTVSAPPDIVPTDDDLDDEKPVVPPSDPNTPAAFTHLRTLHLVRQKLMAVQRLFEKALRWSTEPALPVNEVEYILASTGSSVEGVKKARGKVEEWREVWGVFKGTVEEGPKGKVLKEAEDIVRRSEGKTGIKEEGEEREEVGRKDGPKGDNSAQTAGSGVYGLIGGLGWGIRK